MTIAAQHSDFNRRSECKTRLRGLNISVRVGGLRNMSHDFNRWHLITMASMISLKDITKLMMLTLQLERSEQFGWWME